MKTGRAPVWSSTNVDMNAKKDNDRWPLDRLQNKNRKNRWLHGDAWDVAFPYVHIVYEMITEAGLK